MKKCLSLLLSLLLAIGCCVTAFAEEDIVELYIQMTVEMEDGLIIADLVDDQGGTVSTWPVSLEIDGVQVDTVTTDEYGTAEFDYAIPDDAQQIACVAQDGQYDIYRFIGCTVYLDYTPDTESDDTPDQDETEEPTESTESTETTTSVVVATTTTVEKKPANSTPMTTVVNGDLVAVGVNADNALLIAAQSTQAEYQSRARMWMDNALYRSLVPTSSSSLQLSLELNSEAGEIHRLIAAKNATPAYASYTDEEVKGFAMDLQINYVDEYSVVPLEIEDGNYKIEIPVPSALKSSQKIAVAVCTEDGLSTLIEVKPGNGVLSFTIQRFQTLAIVGFGNSAVSLDALTQTPWLLILVVVFGLVLIAGGITLLVFVTLRKKNTASSSQTSTEHDDTKRVSLEDDEDVVVVKPRTETASKKEMPAKPQQPSVAPFPVVQPVPAPVEEVPAKETSSDVDDLLDDLLNDLDNMDS